LSIREKKNRRTGADDWLAGGPEYVEVKLLMEVTVVKLTDTVAVQTSPWSRFAYVAVTALIDVPTGSETVVTVVHIAGDSWRFKP
jgi:hypothetical protein